MYRKLPLAVFVMVLAGLLAVAPCRAEKPLVRFGATLYSQPITMFERYQPLMDYLTENTPYRFELVLGEDYLETARLLKEGKVEIAAVGDGGLAKAVLGYGMVPIVKPRNDKGRPVYRSCLVVPVDSPIRSVRDLRGKRVAFAYRHSISGNLFAWKLLSQYGMKGSDFSDMETHKTHGEALASVLRGEHDAAFVREATALHHLKRGVRMIACSEEIPSVPLLARPATPKEVVAQVTAALLKLDPANPRHRAVLKSLDREFHNGFVPASRGDYREVLSLYARKPYGCGMECHRR
ncbi:PhnD/SsuA/transferrin family substrate-binding protein [Geomonas sp. Red32]|uniref:PhnD/SsuA/transferrin family substrate-binding protein n=1 Tax=Geomonas sp. Red32 TaxID=2912856 RepID=UPI00202CBA86|nr:PhnD/SsuA/transferrin family substrate-binding protein [Geomonas sp. Red32]MCM0082765.1 PhnD/SsuA/transferrin family substrate-binding protein [Geomonas sp. Red32]